MEFARKYFYSMSRQMRKDIINVQHEMALTINVAHTKLRAMR